jgi:acyl-coenzyme A synthetase/AMP-(fatty) acid ligase
MNAVREGIVVAIPGPPAHRLTARCAQGTGRLVAQSPTATGATFRKGREVPLKGIVDSAADAAGGCVERVVVLPRAADPPPVRRDRDMLWPEFLARASGHSGAWEATVVHPTRSGAYTM